MRFPRSRRRRVLDWSVLCEVAVMRLDFKGFFRLFRSTALPLLVVALVGCAPRVYVEQDGSARFADFHTYAWLSPPPGPVRDPILDSQILEDRVRRAVIGDLDARGFVPAPSATSADFLVTYHTASKQKLESYGSGFTFGVMDAWPHGFGGLVMAPQVESREEGTLMLDIIDGKSKRLVWRGWTTGLVSQGNYSDASVNEAVHQILSKLPGY